MSDKLKRTQDGLLMFHCPGCECAHGVRPQGPGPSPQWGWNGSMDRPTFSPSLLVTTDYPDHRDVCHSFVRDGQIQFLTDCTHGLAGRTVEIPDWD